MSQYIIFDLDRIFELSLAATLDIDFFPDGEVVTKVTEQLKLDQRKKIVIVKWWIWAETDLTPFDLSWADLVICYTGELIFGPWETYYQNTITKFNNKNFICVSNGISNMGDYPKDRVFDKLGHFFSRIVQNCYYEEWRHGPKTKLFDALLGLAKRHRKFVFSKLKEHNLLESSFVNIWGEENYRSPELDILNDPAIHQHKTLIDKYSTMIQIPGLQNGISMSHSIPTAIYNQSWYSIVAETGFLRSMFLTEKTAKPIFEKRLFVMFGSPGLLKRLHDQGYKTFSNVIDESYDDEPDNVKRWNMAFDQVLKLSTSDPIEIYQRIEPILAHNYTTICNHTSRLMLLKEFLDQHIFALNNIPNK